MCHGRKNTTAETNARFNLMQHLVLSTHPTAQTPPVVASGGYPPARPDSLVDQRSIELVAAIYKMKSALH